jgi:hypothetical protein
MRTTPTSRHATSLAEANPNALWLQYMNSRNQGTSNLPTLLLLLL